MPDTESDQTPPLPDPISQGTDNKLTGERFEELHLALELLYIKNNLSARINFNQDWPEVALRIFGKELIRYDTEGAADREKRSFLEDDAEEKRLELLEIMETLEERSVDRDALVVEYAKEVVEDLGRDIALIVYSERIVDKFIAPSAKSGKEETDAKEPGRKKRKEPDATPLVRDSDLENFEPIVPGGVSNLSAEELEKAKAHESSNRAAAARAAGSVEDQPAGMAPQEPVEDPLDKVKPIPVGLPPAEFRDSEKAPEDPDSSPQTEDGHTPSPPPTDEKPATPPATDDDRDKPNFDHMKKHIDLDEESDS